MTNLLTFLETQLIYPEDTARLIAKKALELLPIEPINQSSTDPLNYELNNAGINLIDRIVGDYVDEDYFLYITPDFNATQQQAVRKILSKLDINEITTDDLVSAINEVEVLY